MNREIYDIAYAVQSSYQQLDVYLPDIDNNPIPVILWLHPGGFFTGDKTDMIDSLVPPALARGYALVAANYRLTDESPFPSQIFDAKAAVRWIRANASRFNFDSNKTAAWGCSAGATLAALLGTSAGIKELEDLNLGNPEQPGHVNAVVDWYGPMDFLMLNRQRIELGYKAGDNTADSMLEKLLGGPVDEYPEICNSINPATYITTQSPPFFIQHGSKDDLVPYLQSLNLANSLRAVLGQEKVVLSIIENANHFSGIHQSKENIAKALDFLDQFLKHSD